MTVIGIVFLGLLVVVAAVLIVIGLRESSGVDPLEARLAEFVERGEMASLEEIELSQPFMERVIFPAAKRFGDIALRFTPQNAIQDARQKLEMAEAPKWIEPTLFIASRFVFGIGGGGLVLLLFAVSPNATLFSVRNLGLIAAVTFVGFFLPTYLADRNIRLRQTEVIRSMPDALDLLTICVEAGLGFDAALKKVVDKYHDSLSVAFARVLQEIQLGKLRREALRDMADRLGVAEMESFVAAVIQSEQMGVSMSRVLRVQADAMRVKRRQRAEEKAQQAPIKMLVPMAFLIFPTILIILLGPAILQLMQTGLSF